MKAPLCLLVLALLVTVVPLASADPDPMSPGTDAGVAKKCVDVDLGNTPPVDVYDCPDMLTP